MEHYDWIGDKMSDYDIKNKVVQANDLVQLSKWNLDVVPLKVFKTLVSCIDTKIPLRTILYIFLEKN